MTARTYPEFLASLPTDAATHNDPSSGYQQRQDEFATLKQQLELTSNRYSNVRGLLFFIAVGLLLLAWIHEDFGQFTAMAGGLFFVGFLVLVKLHRQIITRLDYLERLCNINQQAIARRNRKWDDFPEATVDVPREHRTLSGDLNLFGHASAFHLICHCFTHLGKKVLRNWLLQPADPAEIKKRQSAAKSLAPHVSFRQSLHLLGELLTTGKSDPQSFYVWSSGERWFQNKRFYYPLACAMPALLLLLLVLEEFAIVPAYTWVLVLVVNGFLSALVSGPIHQIFNKISTGEGMVNRYCQLFELVSQMPTDDPRLSAINQQIQTDGVWAHQQLAKLDRIMSLADVRFSPMVFSALQLFTLWNLHVIFFVDRWQARYGRHVEPWFSALAELEAISSLATVAYDNPTWCWPEVEQDQGDLFSAQQIGHPLISAEARVCNSVELGPEGTLLLVTGSNMSGKSTLLRTIGVSAVLAQAGSPICAETLKMPRVQIASSMCVHDSLEDGVSFFMAELQRLKQIVDQADEYQRLPSIKLLYLLDEILQGTNTAERQIAVREVLIHLLKSGAIGAVSTHDLDLPNMEPLKTASQCVHFRESFQRIDGQPKMTFDYQLRAGIAVSTNALKLLEIVGLKQRDSDET